MTLSDTSFSKIIVNRTRGLIGEKIAMEDYVKQGFEIIPTRRGSDFLAIKKIDSKIYREYVEVKTGGASQTPFQKKKMRQIKRNGHQYTIYRISTSFLDNYFSSLGRSFLWGAEFVILLIKI